MILNLYCLVFLAVLDGFQLRIWHYLIILVNNYKLYILNYRLLYPFLFYFIYGVMLNSASSDKIFKYELEPEFFEIIPQIFGIYIYIYV